MQLRFSSAIGMPVWAEREDEQVGLIRSVLADPDRGTIEGFFVHPSSLFSPAVLFLSQLDVVRFGKVVQVRSADLLGEPQEVLRIAPLLRDTRTYLRRAVVCEDSGLVLGRCVDAAFDTTTFELTWLFLRKHYFWEAPAVSAKEIVRVTANAIIIREPLRPIAVAEEGIANTKTPAGSLQALPQ